MRNFLFLYWKQNRKAILVFTLFCLIFILAFSLSHLPFYAVWYPSLICLLLGLVFLGFDLRRAYRKHQTLEQIGQQGGAFLELLPRSETLDDQDYQKMVQQLHEHCAQMENQLNARYADMVDYYTLWAHQIKTPISSMRLTLQNEDSEVSRKLAEDLLCIEQYVEMVLCYLRLDSNATDYVIREVDLDVLIRQAIRKFSGQFIRRKIGLQYHPFQVQVLTDEKWLLFVIEQVLSNALKYTPSGTITIDMEEPKTLCIRDTGIGIAPEDLPRIFDKGFTGYNGRSDKKASGIGLYLCRRICSNLGHTITVQSSLEDGTVIRIGLNREKLEVE